MTAPTRTGGGSTGTNPAIALTLKKGLTILSLFDADHPEWSFTDIWRRARLPRPTAFRLVKTLEEANYLSFDSARGTYHLGASFLKATYLMLSPSELARVAHPYMVELAAATTETVILAVQADHEAVIADRVLTDRPFKPDNPVGLSMPGLANIHNRIFLAYRPEPEQMQALSRPFDKRTEFTPTDPARLKEQLIEIRRDGLAYGEQEWNLGMCAVGAPVFDAGRQVRASLAVIAPVERFGPDERAACGSAVRRTSKEISRALGYRANV